MFRCHERRKTPGGGVTGRRRLLRVFKLLLVFTFAPVLVLYLGTAVFAFVTHLGANYKPDTFLEWLEFMHFEAIWMTLFVSPIVVFVSVLGFLPAYMSLKKKRLNG